jgi:hypothetical protein
VGATDLVLVQMRIGFSALSAISALACANAVFAAQAPLAVYYSFDSKASPALLSTIQSEMAVILAPSGMTATWIQLDPSRRTGEDFAGLVVMRFHGRCSFDGVADKPDYDGAGKPLAQTDMVDGHVLPYATVHCDAVRDFIAPILGSMPWQWKTQMLGRALARVSAHEIYHMLAGVSIHDERDGIFQPSHSRQDLTEAVFAFAAPEKNWLHAWMERQRPPEPAVQAGAADDPATAESDSSAFAGR